MKKEKFDFTQPVAIIDSGIGGVSLFEQFFKELPICNYIYFADTKNIPYGEKTREELLCITIKNINYLIKTYKVKTIIFGCNTIGTTIFDEIKSLFIGIKFFAIKPNLDKLTFETKSKNKILVIATSSTIDSLKNKFAHKSHKNSIVLCKTNLLASKIENNLDNILNIVPYIKRKINKYKNFDYIILGCTHYYFAKSVIQNLFPKPIICDGRQLLTKQIKDSFLFCNEKNNFNTIKLKLILTKDKSNKSKIYKDLIQSFSGNKINFL